MAGKIVINHEDLPIQDPLAENLVAECSISEPKIYGNGDIKIIAVDCGMKYNIIRQLTSLPNTTIKIVPWNYDFTQEHYDGLFLSNGPGDPALGTHISTFVAWLTACSYGDHRAR
jgi:carbamoyl-phosphate synthase small subunit